MRNVPSWHPEYSENDRINDLFVNVERIYRDLDTPPRSFRRKARRRLLAICIGIVAVELWLLISLLV